MAVLRPRGGLDGFMEGIGGRGFVLTEYEPVGATAT